MIVAAPAQPSVSIKTLRRELDAAIDAAQNSDAVSAPQMWSVAADNYVKLAKAELDAFNTKSSRLAGVGHVLGLRDGVESRGLIVTQGIAAAMGQLGESSELSGKYTAASQALIDYENRGDR